jgi:hypothetical protein
MKEIQLSPDSRVVYQPRWASADKKVVRAIVRAPDGKLTEMEGRLDAVPKHPLVRDVFLQYEEADLDRNSAWESRVLEVKRALDARLAEYKAKQAEKDVTFLAKTKALELPEVVACKDPRVARKIRKARSSFEVGAWVTVALLKALEEDRE